MKSFLLFLLLLFSLGAVADQSVCDKLKAENATPEQLAQRGCCSWHGGVCGCSGGRTQCCDGQLSPSCRCHADDPKEPKLNEADAPKG